ncbi:MAG: radical SAM protein [Vicinamibacterales bacterium]
MAFVVMMAWPSTAVERDRFVLDRRPLRPTHDPWRAQGVLVEDERTGDGRIVPVATLFLTGRECPWRCAMCDLWQHTTAEDTPAGAIPAQIAAACRAIGGDVRQIKLYNAGSFFDPRAVPEADYASIAALLGRFERVIVESHPSLIGPRLDRFLGLLGADRDAAAARDANRTTSAPPVLEVAMGLETAHPVALERLHKRMTLDDFAAAASELRALGVRLRVFLLIGPPFVPPDEQDPWLLRSLDAALASGASVISLIPTRPGNGAIEALAAERLFRAPTLDDIERSADIALAHVAGRARLFVDLWEIERFAGADDNLFWRKARLHAMNLRQQPLPRVPDARGNAESPRQPGLTP